MESPVSAVGTSCSEFEDGMSESEAMFGNVPSFLSPLAGFVEFNNEEDEEFAFYCSKSLQPSLATATPACDIPVAVMTKYSSIQHHEL